MESAVERLNISGAVRHGPECFNFYFPQDLDDEYLIVWSGFKGHKRAVPFISVSEAELRDFLLAQIYRGYA